MHTVITFDLGQVLFNFDLMRSINAVKPFSALDPQTIRRKLFSQQLGIDFELGIISPEVFYSRFLSEMEITPDSLSFESLVSIFNNIFTPNQQVIDLLVSLAEQYTIGILSNTNILHYTYLTHQYPVFKSVYFLILSHEVQRRKPDPLIYRTLIETAKAKPSDILFIDDIPANVTGARNAGIDSILFTGYHDLKRELYARNILS